MGIDTKAGEESELVNPHSSRDEQAGPEPLSNFHQSLRLTSKPATGTGEVKTRMAPEP